jgi:DNA-binding transcriptional MerR regulator
MYIVIVTIKTVMMKKIVEDSGAYPYLVEQLIEAAQRVISSDPDFFSYSQGEISKDINIRLIRDYVVREIIPRPHRVGRVSRFGSDHLIQLLAVRKLLRSDKWSLPAIKAHLETMSRDEVLDRDLAAVRSQIEREFRGADVAKTVPAANIPKVSLNSAQMLIRKFKQAESPENMPVVVPMSVAKQFQYRPEFKTKLHFELEQGCEFVVDAAHLRSLTPNEIERIAKILKSRLMKETAR